ncbi:MAG: hypothetical protein LBK02_08080, partial [Treponema sp.]|nr:hypothetical protein [Treponema sp.]
LWDSATVSQETLNRLKKDLDRATDAFDRLRLFQFPVDGVLALSSLKDKKWRRMVARGGTAPQNRSAVKVNPVKKTPARPAAKNSRGPGGIHP